MTPSHTASSAKIRRFIAATMATVVAILSSTTARAQLLSTTLDGNGESQLQLITLGPGTTKAIAPTRIFGSLPISVSALATEPGTGAIFGATSIGSFFYPSSLVRINPLNGIATVVGSLGTSAISDMSFSPNGQIYGWDTSTGLTVIIDPTTATVRTLGSSPFFTGTIGGGFAVDSTGVQFVSSGGANGPLRSAPANSGIYSTIANITGTPYPNAIRAMSFLGTTLFAINISNSDLSAPVLVSLNPATAVSTSIAALPIGSVSLTTANFSSLPAFSSVPQQFKCTPTNQSVTCSFLPSENDGTPPPTAYQLRCASTNTSQAFFSATGTSSPITIRGLSANTLYYCSVAAVNSAGEGPPSAIFSVAPYSSLSISGSPDLNGDGKSEILTVRGSDELRIGQLDSASQKISFFPKPAPGGDFRVLGAGDFARTYRSALAVQNSLGDVRFCFDTDCGPDGNQFVRNVKLTWTLEAIADFDGDNKSDLLWRYSLPNSPDTGAMFIWFMDGSTISEIKVRGGAPLSWRVVGSADTNGDGMADIILQSPSGDLRVLTAGAGRSFTNQLIGKIPAGFTALKAADFNGDGKADILLRNPLTGEVAIWSLNGAVVTASLSLPSTDKTWQFYSVGDYNGDGIFDIVWQKPDGNLVAYLMNKTAPTAPTILNNAGLAPAGFAVVLP